MYIVFINNYNPACLNSWRAVCLTAVDGYAYVVYIVNCILNAKKEWANFYDRLALKQGKEIVVYSITANGRYTCRQQVCE